MLNAAISAPSGLVALALAVGIAAVGGPALTEPSTAQATASDLSANVEYRDLDLTTDAGRLELQHRVRVAARELCDQQGRNLMAAMALTCEHQVVTRSAEMQRRVIAEARARAATVASANGR
jgi:UrcA family protein